MVVGSGKVNSSRILILDFYFKFEGKLVMSAEKQRTHINRQNHTSARGPIGGGITQYAAKFLEDG